MTLLNAWVLFGLIPVYFIYTKDYNQKKQTKLLYISLLFMFLAMARPALENVYVKQNFDSHDYIIAIDASYSMQADDLKPNRYILAKMAIKKLIKLHPKDRFTLFAFTSSTLLISPPTTDTQISMMALDALNPKYILTKSTNLKNLFKTVAELPQKQKNLIIFSDGGDEHDITTLANIAQKNSIIPYIVATATQKGATLKKDGRYIKNSHESIVISKINPMLVDLANATHGKYYQLTSLSTINTLSNDIESQQTKQEQIQIKTYREFFFIPLALSLIIYFFSITKLAQKYLLTLSLFLLIPIKSEAGIFDFYYLNQATKEYHKENYKKAAIEFQKIAPSTKSYYNIATSYYKAGQYKHAIEFYTQIKTKDKTLKQKIFYNLGNCAVKLKKYDQAKEYYIDALSLGDDADAIYNLTLLRKLKLKTADDITKMLHKNQKSKKKSALKKSSTKKNNQSSSNTNKNKSNSSNTQSNDSGSSKSAKKNQDTIKSTNKKKSNYKFSYKAYEKINKGYTDEKEPW